MVQRPVFYEQIRDSDPTGVLLEDSRPKSNGIYNIIFELQKHVLS